MNSVRIYCLMIVLALGTGAGVHAADPPAPPAVSTYAPADLLDQQVREYVKAFQIALVDEKSFDDAKSRLRKDAHTLAVLAVALGRHDTPTSLQKSAAALLPAAQHLAKADDFASARKGLEAVEAAIAAPPNAAAPPEYSKVASLGQLMKQVTFINNRLKRGTRPGPRFASQAAENARYAATLAVIGQALLYDTHEVKDPAQMPKWYADSEAMRDAAGELVQALSSKNAEAAAASLTKIEHSCKTCHETRPSRSG